MNLFARLLRKYRRSPKMTTNSGIPTIHRYLIKFFSISETSRRGRSVMVCDRIPIRASPRVSQSTVFKKKLTPSGRSCVRNCAVPTTAIWVCLTLSFSCSCLCVLCRDRSFVFRRINSIRSSWYRRNLFTGIETLEFAFQGNSDRIGLGLSIGRNWSIRH